MRITQAAVLPPVPPQRAERMRLPVRLRRFAELARSRVGRVELLYAAFNKAWPLLSAVATVHRRWLGRRTKVVAVVGSFGKTTAARCVAAALGLPERQPRDNCRSHLALAVLARTGWRGATVLEVGIDHPGQMASYARVLRPDVAVVTSIGSEHGRSLGGRAATRREKAMMVRALPGCGLAVLNGDDPEVAAMRGDTSAAVVTFGTEPWCDVRASGITLDFPRGMRFRVEAGGEAAEVTVRLCGREMVYPVLAALAVARAAGVPLAEAAARVANVAPAPGRLQRVALPVGATLVRDEFKSTLETVHAALDLLEAVPARRRIVVLGDVSEPEGSQGPIYRALGARVAAIADYAVFLGRKTSAYRSGALRAGLPPGAVAAVGHDVALASRLVRERLRPGDVVLVKGRDNERLDRISLALMGRDVRCTRPHCYFLKTRCEGCSLLSREDAAQRTRYAFPHREAIRAPAAPA
ncbi:MAG TPA: Mur ligase family protein [Thermoanaerobaculaceae bacterium]|nr:Mur ligase family protein [Thermoanaerobaculaceae bacterium]